MRLQWGRCPLLFVDCSHFLFWLSWINRKSYFSLLTSKKFERARGERDTRDCVRVKHIQSEKWVAARKIETVGKILRPDIFPVLLRGCIHFVHVVYLSFGVRKSFLIALSTGSYFYFQSKSDTLSFFFFFFQVAFCQNPWAVIIKYFLVTLEIH